MENKVNLTIAIPTYNGEKYLSDVLDSIFEAIQNTKFSSSVEVLINDNCSEDNTENIVKIKQKNHPISYYRNDKNLGFDRNVDLCFQRAKGEFVWLVGDDDYIANNSIQNIIEIIDTYGCRIHNIYVNPITQLPFYPKNNILTTNLGDFFNHTKVITAFMTSHVINKNTWNTLIKQQYFFEQGWIHFMTLYSLPYNTHSYILSSGCFQSYQTIRPWENPRKKIALGTALIDFVQKDSILLENEKNKFLRLLLKPIKKEILNSQIAQQDISEYLIILDLYFIQFFSYRLLRLFSNLPNSFNIFLIRKRLSNKIKNIKKYIKAKI